jgi:cation diffusion facilitator CzcD-associated flavoprotein CzcO
MSQHSEPRSGEFMTGDRSEHGGSRRDLRIAIIGAGPGGISMAHHLLEAGFTEIVILEKAAGVGGTWFHNRYPGCACDVPAHLYSFSFAPIHDWSRPYPPQPEILDYLKHVADAHGVTPLCRFDTEVTGARWDERSATWSISIAGGDTVEADVAVSAIGMFNELAFPDIDGLAEFDGTMFHSARWDWSHDLTGERVAVIGSAASAVQFVPEIVGTAGQVHLFQRTANWVLPKADDPYPAEVRELFMREPERIMAIRAQIYNGMDSTLVFSDKLVNAEREDDGLGAIAVVDDPDVRARLVPDHPFGCKRPLFSNDYYPAFNRPNLELVTDPIDRITADGIVTADGVERQVDTIILSTGFQATKFLSAIDVVGRDGRTIADAWNAGAQAHLGITTSGFPNLFMLYGPNTNNGSLITMIEFAVHHVVAQVERIADDDLAWVDVRKDVMDAYNDDLQRSIGEVDVWNAGCNDYYRTPEGRVVTQWPFSMSRFRDETATIDPDAYEQSSRRRT